jgi:hypothetical protein
LSQFDGGDDNSRATAPKEDGYKFDPFCTYTSGAHNEKELCPTHTAIFLLWAIMYEDVLRDKAGFCLQALAM